MLELFDDLVGRQVAPLGVVLGLAQLDHAYQMTLDMATGNEFHKVCTGKPAINEQIVETDAAFDGILHHLDGLVNLRHRVLLDAFLDALSCVVGRETLAALLVRQPLLLIWITALLAMKREVEEKMAQSVGIEQCHTLIAEDGLVQDMGEYLADNLQGALPAIALTGHSALSTAFMNDSESVLVFAQQVNGYGKEGDVLLGISTSGNSKNVIYAAITAKARGLKVIGLTGERESKLSKLADCCIRVPEVETYKVQEMYLPVYHCLCMMLEEKFFGKGEIV